MANPPDNIEASELWLALTQLPRPHKMVDIPRCLPGTTVSVGQVAMWPLTQEETMACNAEADRFTKKLMQDPQKRDEANLGYQHTYANEVAVQILSRVCRDANDLKKPAFPSPKLIRSTFTADEVGVMFSQYLTVELEMGPIIADMSEEEMEAWIRKLALGGSAYPFAGLSSELQNRLVLFMAVQYLNSQTAMSSVGLPPDEPLLNETSEVTPED